MGELTVEALRKINEDLKGRKRPRGISTIHTGTCGIASGAEGMPAAPRDAAEDTDRSDIMVKTSDCAGLCSRGLTIAVGVRGTAPVKDCGPNLVKAAKVSSEQVIGGKPVVEYGLGATGETTY